MLCRQSSYVTLDTYDLDGVFNVIGRRLAELEGDPGRVLDHAQLIGAWKALYIVRHMSLRNQEEFFEVFDKGELKGEEAD